MNIITNILDQFKQRIPTKLQKKLSIVLVLTSVVLLHLFLITQNISDPFLRYNEDNNALYSIAAQNFSSNGVFPLKFGLATGKIVGGAEMQYYTHHPSFFVLPTALIYSVFGVSELTTRLAPALFSVMSVVLIFLLVLETRKKLLLAFFASFLLATAPALAFYGKMLDPEVFVIFFSLLSIYLFYLQKRIENRYLKYTLFASIFFGMTMGWHFYFTGLVIWLAILSEKKYPNRRLLLLGLPILVLVTVSLQVGQFWLLSGENGVQGFLEAGALRTEGVAWPEWSRKMLTIGQYEYGAVAIFIASAWAIFVTLLSIKRREFSLPTILLMIPVLIMVIFRQWMMHFYSLMYFAPFIALALAEVLNISYEVLKKIAGSTLIAGVVVFYLLLGKYFFTTQALAFFENAFSVDRNTIETLKIIKSAKTQDIICFGESSTGQVVEAIYGYYLEARMFNIKNCALNKKVNLAVIGNPQISAFEAKIYEEYQQMGYTMLGCGGKICALELSSFEASQNNNQKSEK